MNKIKGKKTGGRVAGTPNKVSAKVREAMANVLDNYFGSKKFAEDMNSLDPKDRVAAMEKFASYVSPKLQSTTVDMAIEAPKTIEDRLKELAEEE